jgi:hypothetical protein
VLADTKEAVLTVAEQRADLSETARDKFLLKAAGSGIQFYNTAPPSSPPLSRAKLMSATGNPPQPSRRPHGRLSQRS